MDSFFEDLQALHDNLQSFPLEAHWFCPKISDDDTINYVDFDIDEGEAPATLKQERIRDGEKRRDNAYPFMTVLALHSTDDPLDPSGGRVLQWQKEYRERLEDFLMGCDKCVKNYHLCRRKFLNELAEQYEDDIIEQMSKIIDGFDFRRIDEGLLKAKDILSTIPDHQRSTSALALQDPTALQALYEALCCPAYHTSEEKLSLAFNDVFSLIQSKKVLILGDIVPATTRFLFSSDRHRQGFATKGWTSSRTDQTITKSTFAWLLHDALTDAIRAASIPGLTIPELERFWTGIALILEKFDDELITHSLRGMEIQPDIYFLALQTLPCDAELVVLQIIKALQILVVKSPKSFWDAYGSISPSTVAEQIFNSPAFIPLLSKAWTNADIAEQETIPVLAWISPFIESLEPNQQFEACRTILSALFTGFQVDKLQIESRFACFQAGLHTLAATLSTFTADRYKISASTSFITINNILGLVDRFKGTIIKLAVAQSKTPKDQAVAKLGLDVVRLSLLLDCKAFRAQFQAIQDLQVVHSGLDSHSESIWQVVLDNFYPDNMAMAQDILAGIQPLIGLDKFSAYRRDESRNLIPLNQDEMRFNKDFGPLAEMVTRIFERLSDFSPENLRQLFKMSRTSVQLYAGLTPAYKSTYESAIEIIKTVTGEESRQEAISSLLRQSLEPTLSSMYHAVRAASALETFAAFPFIIKTSRDTLDCLTDAQNGLLRTRDDLSSSEKGAITSWWAVQWQALKIAFGSTERWSQSNTTDMMISFVRDTMDFSETLFDQYSIIASALGLSESNANSTMSSKHSSKFLLDQPRMAMVEITKWLRLRDKYLVSKSTSLVSKLLRRLGEFNMEISTEASTYIEMTLEHTVKTVLTGQQKAELRRALEEHVGLELVEPPAQEQDKFKGRNGVIDLEAWKNSSTKKSFPTVDLLGDTKSLTRGMDKNKSILDRMNARHTALAKAKSNSALKQGETLKESRAREKKIKDARDAAIIAQARLLRGEADPVPGEGSGLKGLGLLGKDHAPPRAEIMVSSGSESESDDEIDGASLIPNKKQAGKKLANRTLKPQIQEGPVKKKKIIRSAKDMRARLVPNMDALHQTILEWEIFHDGDEPPGGIDCERVPDTFQQPDAYKMVFQPLLVSEAWRSFKTAKEDSTSKPFEVKIANRMNVDRFYEVSSSITSAANREAGIMEGDIILLSKGQDPMADRNEPHCLARVFRTNRKKDVVEISYRISGTLPDKLRSSIAPGVKFNGVKITSMTTIEREYAALSSLPYYDLCDEILSAKPSPILRYTDIDVSKMQARYEVNSGQAKAILCARDNDGFTLIQGPPGSGKTKTITAMVGALLTDSFVETGVSISRPAGIGPPQPAKTQKKLLICAPSNAAVDELVSRLKAGVKTLKGETHKISVVRLGRTEAINANVKDVTLDELVRVQLEGDNRSGKMVVSTREKLHQEAGKVKESLAVLRPKLDEARASGDQVQKLRLEREFEGLKRQQAQLGTKIDEDKDNGNTVARDNELNRRRIQQQIIDGAHVLCSTLSGSGHEMFKNLNVEFETVIIDEAAQCIELSALIPLKYGCSKCILVGDPKQLPPTVLSRSAARFGYEQSLFVRMQQNHPENVHLLDTQYRMHPEISLFPSDQFYDGRLIDGPGMAKARSQPWHASALLGPYRFFDVKGAQQSGARGHSYINMAEIDVALQMYQRLKSDFRDIDFRHKVGIITPYKAQLNQLRTRFSQRYGEEILENIDFNTTDSFQGREAEIIIFSCVRAQASGGIGFLEDIRRMNVGLTRAKSSLWVLGNSNSLMQGEFWARLVENARARRMYIEGDVMSLLQKPVTAEERQKFATTKIPLNTPKTESHESRPPSPMDDIVYTSAKVTVKTEPKQEIKEPQKGKPVSNGSIPGLRKPTNAQGLADRMRKATATGAIATIRTEKNETKSIDSGALLDKNEHNKRQRGSDSPPLLPNKHTAKGLNTPTASPTIAARAVPPSRPNPSAGGMGPGPIKVIKRKPAADPLLRAQRRPK